MRLAAVWEDFVRLEPRLKVVLLEAVTGRYFQKLQSVPSSRASYDTAAAARLWQGERRDDRTASSFSVKG